nr:MAG TPA: hypothetical protein [Bacteriophage sp.]
MKYARATALAYFSLYIILFLRIANKTNRSLFKAKNLI